MACAARLEGTGLMAMTGPWQVDDNRCTGIALYFPQFVLGEIEKSLGKIGCVFQHSPAVQTKNAGPRSQRLRAGLSGRSLGNHGVDFSGSGVHWISGKLTASG